MDEWVNDKIFNVCVLVFSKILKKPMKKHKIVCVLPFFRYQAKLFAYTFTYYACTSMLAIEWSMI